MDNIIEKDYKEVSLIPLENEEYELNNDNIGEIQILNIKRDASKSYKVVLELSKEAMIGFGISAIRLEDGWLEEYAIRTEPLGSCSISQPMGFFLTPGSPELFIYGKEFGLLKDNSINITNYSTCKSDHTMEKRMNILVNMERYDDFYEIYNIGFNNIARIKVYENDKDITSKCDIIFRLSKSAFLGLGISLLRMAHKYKVGDSYLNSSIEPNSEFGFYLTKESPLLEIRCEKFENAFYYDKNLG